MSTNVSKFTKNQLVSIVEKLLTILDERSQDVIKKRFGLESGQQQTLESIGDQYGITRERVRQIEAQAKRMLAERTEDLTPASELYASVFQNHGGALTEEQVRDIVRMIIQEELDLAYISFYLDILPPYTYVTNENQFQPHWRHPEFFPDHATEVVTTAKKILEEANRPHSQDELIEAIRKQFADAGTPLSNDHIYAWLVSSKHMQKNPFKEWGLVGWPEITPRGVGDKAYAVLRRYGKPAHFRTITDLINDAHFDRKRANAQTVHNELIKDSRFVLVGRGMYGLTEWGYIPGTVADVLEAVLKQAQMPLSREELIEKVLAERLVKKNTILLSLQDQSRFFKNAENRYTLRKKS